MIIGERARQAIAERAATEGKDAISYAAEIGITKVNYRNWAKRVEPCAYSLSLLAEAGLDVHWILTGKKGGLAMSNPYWDNVCAIAERQRAKGVATYGQGIEMNPADAITRIEYLQEELVDALMYCEWIKDSIRDIAEAVRCKGCVRYNTKGCADGFGWCEAWEQGRMDNDFCSYGAKAGRDGENAAD